MGGAEDLEIRFWGVRGSRPVPGPTTAKTGGNTSCVEMRAGGRSILFDAGTGIVPCGARLVQAAVEGDVDIFVSHLHHDHIEGLRFFPPLYRVGWRCRVYGPETPERDFAQRLKDTMGGQLFPVAASELPAKLTIHGLADGESIRLATSPSLIVESAHTGAHPNFGVRLYRLRYGRAVVVYATDVEAPAGGFDEVVRFASGADLLIHDAQYTDREYYRAEDGRAGWGHSTVRMAAEAARAAGVGRMILYHHDPERRDGDVPKMERAAQAIFPKSKAAYEGMRLRLTAGGRGKDR